MNVLRQEIRTGLLVVFSLAVLFLVLLYLGAPGVFIPQKTYYIYVTNAFGLKQGADVAVAGRKVGQVIQLFSPVPVEERPEPRAETMVEVRVRKDAKIYQHVHVQITSSSLLGEMFIDFTAGDAASGDAPAKYKFFGDGPSSIADALPKLLERLDPIIKQANSTLEVLQTTASNINRITASDGELQVAMSEFRKVGSNLNTATGPDGPLRQTLDNVSHLTGEDGKIAETLNNLLGLTGPDSDFAKTMKNAEKFTADLQKNRDIALTLQNSRRATEELNSTIGELRFKFSVVAENLAQASDTVKRQPWRLIWPTTKKYEDLAATPVQMDSSKPHPNRRSRGSVARTRAVP